MSDNTIWLCFGFYDPEPDSPSSSQEVVTSLRIHIGPLTERVMEQMKKSIIMECKKRGRPLSYIEARPKANKPTTNGHQRWPNSDGWEHFVWGSKEWKAKL